jgi:hypothetical protein
MTLLSSPFSASTPSSRVAALVFSNDDAQNALECLLELGVQIVDGNVQALLEIPAMLSRLIEALDNVHAALSALPANGGPALRGILAAHSERRRQLDLQELDKLVAAVKAADQPNLVGRSVVIATLVLLSNLSADERWLSVLSTTHRAAYDGHIRGDALKCSACTGPRRGAVVAARNTARSSSERFEAAVSYP